MKIFCISESYKYLVGTRDMQDKKGGGLMVVARSRELVMERQDTSNSDILEARMENWNQDLPERYSKFCGLYIKFQGHGKWP